MLVKKQTKNIKLDLLAHTYSNTHPHTPCWNRKQPSDVTPVTAPSFKEGKV